MSITSTDLHLPGDTVERFLATIMESWRTGDQGELFDFIDDDVDYFDDGMPGPVRGKQAARAFFDEVGQAITEFEAVILDGPFTRPDSPTVMIYFQYGGTHTGAWGELQATGRHFSVDGASLYEFRHGKVVRWRCMWNAAEMVRQLTAPAS